MSLEGGPLGPNRIVPASVARLPPAVGVEQHAAQAGAMGHALNLGLGSGVSRAPEAAAAGGGRIEP